MRQSCVRMRFKITPLRARFETSADIWSFQDHYQGAGRDNQVNLMLSCFVTQTGEKIGVKGSEKRGNSGQDIADRIGPTSTELAGSRRGCISYFLAVWITRAGYLRPHRYIHLTHVNSGDREI